MLDNDGLGIGMEEVVFHDGVQPSSLLLIKEKVRYRVVGINKVNKVLRFECVLETLLVSAPKRFFLEFLEVRLACLDVLLPVV